MSRPPSPRTDEGTTTGIQNGDLTRLDYLPLAYADLLGLEQNLAVTRLGRPHDSDLPDAAPDTAQTLMELSALVGHVLSVYQRYLASEAFISTAQALSSLVRHAHRLAYEPDAGLAATGYVVLFAKPLVSGIVTAGLPLASVPLGMIKAQDYETRDDLLVDSALNELVPAHAEADHDGSVRKRARAPGHRSSNRRRRSCRPPRTGPDGVAVVGRDGRVGERVGRHNDDPA